MKLLHVRIINAFSIAKSVKAKYPRRRGKDLYSRSLKIWELVPVENKFRQKKNNSGHLNDSFALERTVLEENRTYQCSGIFSHLKCTLEQCVYLLKVLPNFFSLAMCEQVCTFNRCVHHTNR